MSNEQIKYPTREDTSLRLGNSLIRYKGQFVFASLSDSDRNTIDLVVFTKEGKKEARLTNIDPNSADLNVASPELGYMQYSDDEVLYILRPPYRRQKQGVTADGLVYESNSGGFQSLRGVLSIDDPRVVRMLYQNYPSFSDAFKTITTSPNSSRVKIAFDKNLCLSKNSNSTKIHLVYSENTVGFVNRDTQEVSLHPMWEQDSILLSLLVDEKGLTTKNAKSS